MGDQRHLDRDKQVSLRSTAELLRSLAFGADENFWFTLTDFELDLAAAIANEAKAGSEPVAPVQVPAATTPTATVPDSTGAAVAKKPVRTTPEAEQSSPKGKKITPKATQSSPKGKRTTPEAEQSSLRGEKETNLGKGKNFSQNNNQLPIDAVYYQRKQEPKINTKAPAKKTETKTTDAPQKKEATLSAPTSLTNISYADVKPEGRGKSEEYYSNYYLGMLQDSKKASDNNIKKQTAAPTGGVPYWLRLLGDKRQVVNEAVVNRLYELQDLGGWDALLLSSGDPNPLISSAAKAGLRRLSLKHPEFKAYILSSANDHSSALGDYAIKYLMENHHTEGIDKQAFVTTLKGKLDFCKEEVQRIYENDHNAVIDSFNFFIGQVIKAKLMNAQEQPTLAELIETDQKTEVIMTQLHLARRVVETLRPMIKQHFKQNKGATQMNERALEMWSRLKLGLMSLPLIYLPDKQNEYKKGSAKLHDLFSKNTIQELSTASVGDFETQLNLLLWQALQLKNSPAFEEEGGKSNINMALLKDSLADNLQQLQGIQHSLPQIKAAAKSNPHVYFEFLSQSQSSISTVSAKLMAAGVALKMAAAVGGLRRFGLAEINKGLSPFSAEAKKRVAEYNSSSKQIEDAGIAALSLASAENMNGVEIGNGLFKIKQGKGLQTSLTFAQSVGAINEGIAKGLEVAQHFLFEVVLTLVTIMSAGLLTEVTAPLLFIEIAETASALARVSSGIINFGTRLGIETLNFTVINKSLTSATGGEANWQDFGHDYLKNLLTFGALKATGAGYSKATEKFVALSKLQKGIKKVGAFGTEATTLQATDYLNHLYENSKLEDKDKQKYKFGESVVQNLAFLAGLKLGNHLLVANGINRGGNAEEIKANEKIIEKLQERLEEAKTRPLSQAEIQQFNATTIKLARQNEAALRKAARNEKKYSKEERETFGKQATELANQVVETRAFDLETYNLRQAPGNSNVVYFEGDGNSLKEHLHLKKGDSFTKKKGSDNWVLKRKSGEETTYINTKVKENTPEWLDKIDHKEIQKIATIFENNKIDRAIIDKFNTKQVEHLLRANDLFAKKDVIGAGKEMDMAFADAGFINKETRSNIENAFALENKTTAPEFYRNPEVELKIGDKIVKEKPSRVRGKLHYGTDMETLKSELKNIGESTEGLSDVEIVKLLLRKGFGARGPNTNLEHHVNKGDKQETALRGATELPSYPGSDIGAMHWADEGGYVFVLKDVPAWDVNAIFFKNSIKSNKTGEVEHSIGAQILPKHIVEAIPVIKVNGGLKLDNNNIIRLK